MLTIISGGFSVAKIRKHVNIVLRNRLNLSLPIPPASTPKKETTMKRLKNLRKKLFSTKKTGNMGIDESGFNKTGETMLKTDETIIAEGGEAQADSTQYDTVTEERNGGDSEVRDGAVGGGPINGETVTTTAQIELAHVESQSE